MFLNFDSRESGNLPNKACQTIKSVLLKAETNCLNYDFWDLYDLFDLSFLMSDLCPLPLLIGLICIVKSGNGSSLGIS